MNYMMAPEDDELVQSVTLRHYVDGYERNLDALRDQLGAESWSDDSISRHLASAQREAVGLAERLPNLPGTLLVDLTEIDPETTSRVEVRAAFDTLETHRPTLIAATCEVDVSAHADCGG